MGIKNGCNNPNCGASTHPFSDDSKPLSGLTFGLGRIDYNGFWENPCFECARAFEVEHPEAIPCWPDSNISKDEAKKYFDDSCFGNSWDDDLDDSEQWF